MGLGVPRVARLCELSPVANTYARRNYDRCRLDVFNLLETVQTTARCQSSNGKVRRSLGDMRNCNTSIR
jgi:hypothetical protein